jgi:hypothetical protein
MQERERTAGGIRRATAWFAVVATLLAASPSLAQEESGEDREQTAAARALFRQGVEQTDGGHWAEAADLFRRSLALRESAVVAFNLGTALVHTGGLVEASELFRRAARDADAPERLQAAAGRELAAIQPRIGRLTITVEGPLEGVELTFDDRTVRSEMVGVAAPADPGDHVLVARRRGEEVARAEVSVAEGSAASVSLTVPPAPVEVADPEDAARTVVGDRGTTAPIPPGGDDTGLIVGLVAGALALVAVAIIVTVVLLDGQAPSEPIPGNLTPGTIEF